MKGKERKPPKLPDDTDLTTLFGQAAQPGFAGLLDASLAGADLDQVLHEKKRARRHSGKRTPHPPPQERLDLHGLTAREAEQRCELFLARGRQQGLRSLLIITGKGLHSEGEGVLRDLVEALLVDQRRRNLIASYLWEKKSKERSGAVIVHLP